MLCCSRRLYISPRLGPGQDQCVASDSSGREAPDHPSLASCQAASLTCLSFPTEFFLSLLEKMQTQEILRMLRLPELADLGQFFRSLSATTLVSMGALAAILAYWFTHRPKALKPPCNLLMQSEEVKVSSM